MAMSEIDDIFASKRESKVIQQPVASSSTLPVKKEKRDKKQRNSGGVLTDAECPLPISEPFKSSSKRRPPPETVVDPSIRIPDLKRAKSEKNNRVNGASKRGGITPEQKTNDKDGDVRFKDSRGSGTRRKTAEGWAVYKEDELGIGDEGGDTPLCPFDCDCCF